MSLNTFLAKYYSPAEVAFLAFLAGIMFAIVLVGTRGYRPITGGEYVVRTAVSAIVLVTFALGLAYFNKDDGRRGGWNEPTQIERREIERTSFNERDQ